MTVILVFKDSWRVYIAAGSNGTDPLQDGSIPAESLAQIYRLLEHVSKANGPKNLAGNRNHAICSDPLILQLTAHHPFRIAYFYDSEKRVICTHLYEKAGGRGKTPPGEIDRACAIRAAYEAAKANGTLVRVGEDDVDH